MRRWVIAAFTVLVWCEVGAFTLSSSTDSAMRGWANPTVTFNVNTANCPANVFDILDAAIAVWNNVGTSRLVVKRGGASTTTPSQLYAGSATDVPVIACDPNFGTTTGLSAAAVAGAGVALNRSPGGNISYGFMLLNVQPGAGANISNFSSTIVSIVLAHEIGHVLGIGHSADASALMYFDASAKRNLALAQDDVDAVTYLYPRDELGGDQLFGGCARIGAAPPPPAAGLLWMLAVAMAPLVTVLSLRRRIRRS